MTQDKPNRVNPSTTGSQNLYRRPNEPKPLQVLESATNEAGEIFNAGDKIQVSSPWGGKAIAEITGFYQDDSGGAWAQYTPSETREGWTWEGGSIRANLLVKGE
jgi:hypothetical protein